MEGGEEIRQTMIRLPCPQSYGNRMRGLRNHGWTMLATQNTCARLCHIVPVKIPPLLEETLAPRAPSHHARDPVTLDDALQRFVVNIDLCELHLDDMIR